jgi:hypothetical protein
MTHYEDITYYSYGEVQNVVKSIIDLMWSPSVDFGIFNNRLDNINKKWDINHGNYTISVNRIHSHPKQKEIINDLLRLKLELI